MSLRAVGHRSLNAGDSVSLLPSKKNNGPDQNRSDSANKDIVLTTSTQRHWCLRLRCSDSKFEDADLERRYADYFIRGRRVVLNVVCCIGASFSVGLMVLMALNWQGSCWTSTTPAPDNPAGVDLTAYYASRFLSHLALNVAFVSGLVCVHLEHLRSKWFAISRLIVVWVFVVTMSLLLTATVVGYWQYTRVDHWVSTANVCAAPADERISVLRSVVDITLEITSSQKSNSVSMLLCPVFALVFAPPVRTYIALLLFATCFFVIPDWSVTWRMYTYTRTLTANIALGTDNSTATHNFDQMYDLTHDLLQYVLRVAGCLPASA